MKPNAYFFLSINWTMYDCSETYHRDFSLYREERERKI